MRKKKKLTPQQRLLKRKKKELRQERKILKQLEQEDQLRLDRINHQNRINDIRNEMNKIGDIGSLYHITSADRYDGVEENGLMCGSEERSQRQVAHKDVETKTYTLESGLYEDQTFGRIFFTDSSDKRMWNGIVCEMLKPINTNVKEKMDTLTNQGYDVDEAMEYQIKQECDERINMDWIVLEVPKSYFKVMGIEIHQDTFSDVTNCFNDAKYVYVKSIPTEFINPVHIFKSDEKDYHLDYKWELIPYHMEKQDNIAFGWEMDGLSTNKELVEELMIMSGEDDSFDGDFTNLPKKYLFDRGWDGVEKEWKIRYYPNRHEDFLQVKTSYQRMCHNIANFIEEWFGDIMNDTNDSLIQGYKKFMEKWIDYDIQNDLTLVG